MKAYEYYKPQTIQEAIDLMEGLEDARFIAGGTDVLVLLRQTKIAPKNLISLRNIKDLTNIEGGDGLWIGGGATHSDIVKNVFIRQYYSALYDAASNLGSRQIRNVATIGGNICNAAPSADTACPLLVLDARVTVVGKNGERMVDIDAFFLGPNKTVLEKGELVKGFRMPFFGDNTGSAYIKHTRRQAMDLPILGIAARVTMEKTGEGLLCKDARIAMGVVAPRPIRAKEAEAFLKGKTISDDVLQEAGEIAASEATPRDSFRGEAWYRKEMVKVLTRRAIMKAIERAMQPQGVE
ncbi:MAG: FAD binding domain-containing protein [Proteobacteria bacterium]|nr:FAD binding domain-containing protein [Pseudomonadota bacterium]